MTQYIHERGLDSATVAPTEWFDISHPGLNKEMNAKIEAYKFKHFHLIPEAEWNKLTPAKQKEIITGLENGTIIPEIK